MALKPKGLNCCRDSVWMKAKKKSLVNIVITMTYGQKNSKNEGLYDKRSRIEPILNFILGVPINQNFNRVFSLFPQLPKSTGYEKLS